MAFGKKIMLALAHLGLVALGALHVHYDFLGPAGKLFTWYGSLSAADSQYDFFAPGVGSQLRAVFEVVDDKDRVLQEDLCPDADREVSLRVGNIIGLFWDAVDEPQSRRSLAASWAGRVLARYPLATQVQVRLQAYDLPAMADYRRGERPRWNPFYEATFVRKTKG
jgi:hypothetical protein